MLTLVFLMDSINNSLPKVSYVKSIDFYLIGCFVYVFAVVMETVVAFRLHKRARCQDEDQCLELPEAMPKKMPKARKSIATITLDNKAFHVSQGDAEKDTQELSDIHEEANPNPSENRKTDSYCKVLFPLVFLLANTGYWFWLLVWQQQYHP